MPHRFVIGDNVQFHPARWNDLEAWFYWRGEWKSFPPMEVMGNARVVTEAEHYELFSDDPPDPTGSPQRPEEPAAESMAELLENLPAHARLSQRRGVATGIVGFPSSKSASRKR